MRFLCDVHIPIRLSKFLVADGHLSNHINQLLEGSRTSDTDICQYADQNDCIVITKDTDFRNSYLLRKTPAKFIRICLGNIANTELITLFHTHLPLITRLDQREQFYLEIHRDTVLVF